MPEKRDIIITWPKKKPLADYLAELRQASDNDQLINYRVARLPDWPPNTFDYGKIPPRCYVVHSGFIRGWNAVRGVQFREAGEVAGWPEGFYIVRSPAWHQVMPVPMRGFQGWRYYRYDNSGWV